VVVVVVMVMVFGCTSPCWLVQWPTIVAAGSVSQFVIVLFQMLSSWCPVLPECQLSFYCVVDESVKKVVTTIFTKL